MTAIPRRRFLASSTMAASPMLGWSAVHASTAPERSTHASSANPWKLLAVAPASRKMPELARDYRRGVELGLAQHPEVPLQLQWVDAQAVPSKAAREIADQIDSRSDLHGIFGWMPSALAERVVAYANDRHLPLWVSDTGADLPANATRNKPQAQRTHSLELCDCAATLAREVFMQKGARAVLAVGWLESGYDFVYAFEHAYRALGGQVTARHIGGPVEPSREFDGLRRTILEQRPDAVVALYSGAQAVRFGQWWRANAQAQGPWSLAGLPWLAQGDVPVDTLMVGAWPLAGSAAGGDWQHQFERAGLQWSATALLGAEAGFSIGASLRGMGAQPSNSALRDAWSQAALQGPRGHRAWKPQGSAGSLWVSLASSVVSARVTAAPRVEAHSSISGWLNGYLQT
ncbi:hypothetical protein G7048_23095 [Diaphorobacter sp. HDW4B]|uniref:ABC transporter substrate-binding protein n=1 Tax=Diaphorobacter sp. HDW4B TaxID=2714925 RepID=UPI0014096682|nr:ABC transporter substrate-binding protein [Diaphorobacter sp. HDW4B]QIL72981.1 hypothetical protein G7048_23095 [Diaphorobacter sp. HDW4B]